MPHLLALYDAQNHPLGQTKAKKAVHHDGDWHRTSEIVVLNEENELLLTLRHWDKTYLPNFWDVCIGGHLDPGETYEQCALRETEEEIGIRLHPDDLMYLGSMPVEVIDPSVDLIDREWAGIFLYRTRLTLADFTPQPDEVADMRFVPLADVLSDLLVDTSTLSYTPPRATYHRMLAWAVGSGIRQ